MMLALLAAFVVLPVHDSRACNENDRRADGEDGLTGNGMHQGMIPVGIDEPHQRHIARNENDHRNEFLARGKHEGFQFTVHDPHIRELCYNGIQGGFQISVMDGDLCGQTDDQPQRTGRQSEKEAGDRDQLDVTAANAALVFARGVVEWQAESNSQKRSGAEINQPRQRNQDNINGRYLTASQVADGRAQQSEEKHRAL